MLQDNQKKQLEKLLTRLIDSFDGYNECASMAEQHRHNALFKDFGQTRQKFANEIRGIFADHGIDVDDDGSFLAKIHRYYTDLKMKLDSDDEELLESIRYGEGNLIAEYNDTIDAFKSDQNTLEILQRQLSVVRNNFELIDAKEKAA